MSKSARPQPLISASRDLLWPAATTPATSQLLALLYQLEQSQFWPPATLEQAQRLQLSRLLEHARQKSTFYAERLSATGLGTAALKAGDLQQLPLLTRRELLTRANDLDCGEQTPEHGGQNAVQTSGSTGEIVAVRRTGVTRSLLLALGLRVNAWHDFDYRQALCVIRADSVSMDDDERARQLGWGPPSTVLYRTGPAYTLPISTDVAEQAAWLVRKNPGYLLTYPTNLAALLEHFAARNLKLPALRAVRALGETLTRETRARCREVWNVPVVDVYSAQEVGIIAIECPDSGLYHVQSESLIVEVVDDDGRTCEPGQVGRVVVTDLHNFAMPLVRYVIGDHAEVGPACSCGRGLPTLTRVLGRERNMVVLPSGAQHWPLVGLHEYRRIAPVLQYQLVQESLELVELRLVTETPLTPEQERALVAVIQRFLGHPFEVRFRYVEGALARGPGGKFEEFVSNLKPPGLGQPA